MRGYVRWKIVLSLLIFLLILPGLPNSGRTEDFVRCFDLNDERTLAKMIEENPILREQVGILQQKISNLEKENELLRREKDLQEKLSLLAQRETEIYRAAFEKEKDLTDRALKLSEKKDRGLFETWGPVGLIAIIVVTIAAAL